MTQFDVEKNSRGGLYLTSRPLVRCGRCRASHGERLVHPHGSEEAQAHPAYDDGICPDRGLHMLGPATRGADFVRDLVRAGAMSVWWFDAKSLSRAFDLMDTYADHPMDLADASLVVAAESLGTRRVFTLDREDFAAYRIRRGHRNHAFELVPIASRSHPAERRPRAEIASSLAEQLLDRG